MNYNTPQNNVFSRAFKKNGMHGIKNPSYKSKLSDKVNFEAVACGLLWSLDKNNLYLTDSIWDYYNPKHPISDVSFQVFSNFISGMVQNNNYSLDYIKRFWPVIERVKKLSCAHIENLTALRSSHPINSLEWIMSSLFNEGRYKNNRVSSDLDETLEFLVKELSPHIHPLQMIKLFATKREGSWEEDINKYITINPKIKNNIISNSFLFLSVSDTFEKTDNFYDFLNKAPWAWIKSRYNLMSLNNSDSYNFKSKVKNDFKKFCFDNLTHDTNIDFALSVSTFGLNENLFDELIDAKMIASKDNSHTINDSFNFLIEDYKTHPKFSSQYDFLLKKQITYQKKYLKQEIPQNKNMSQAKTKVKRKL